MKFLVFSEITAETIYSSLGLPEYSYYFVLRDFLPVLQALGEVQIVNTPAREVDALYDQAREDGKKCVFLSFTPPHKTPLGLRCPTIPVLAWEFDTIPNESWNGERHQDWRYVLTQCRSAITHSRMTQQLIKTAMGPDFPVISVPSPVWDKFQRIRERRTRPPLSAMQTTELLISQGVVLDSHTASMRALMPSVQSMAAEHETQRARVQAHYTALAGPARREQSRLLTTYRYAHEWWQLVGRPKWLRFRARQHPSTPGSRSTTNALHPLLSSGTHRLVLNGIVFTSMFNPHDGRKNWPDMISAFCAAFQDTPDATLVLKLGSQDAHTAIEKMLCFMARLPSFRCRVIILHGYMEGDSFDALIEATHFAVNTSHGEGQCLPLMEFMSCGCPAVAPRHSALQDYMDEQVGFSMDSWPQATTWPHDPRNAFRTRSQQIHWDSLRDAFMDAYHCAKDDPTRYQRLSENAITRMESHCSKQAALERLRVFFAQEEITHGAG